MAHDGPGPINISSPEKSCPAPCRRTAILDAATDLFLDKGFDGTTLDDLIAAAGGSRRSIYEFFGGKEGLLEAIVSNQCSGLGRRIEELSLEGLEPRAFLVEIGLFFGQMLLTERGVKLYRLIVRETLRNPTLGTLMFECGISPTQRRLEAYLELETRAGRLHVRDASESATIFFGMIKSDVHNRALSFSPTDVMTDEALRARVELAVDIFLDGVRG